jgi:hypothetical protein
MPMTPYKPNVTIPIGGNASFNNIPCYQKGMVFNAPIGTPYRGYLIINYTDLSTNFLHTAEGTLIQKVT